MRKYVTRHQVRHEGKRLPIGSVVELSEQDAKDLGDAVEPQSPASGDLQVSAQAVERLEVEIRAREQAEARAEAAQSALLDLQNQFNAEVRAREEAVARAEAAEKALVEASARAETAEKALADSASAADGKAGKGKTAPLV